MSLAGKSKLSLMLVAATVLLAFSGCTSSVESTRTDQDDLGWMKCEVLLGERYPEFAAVYKAAKIAPEFTELIAETQKGAEFLVFLGTWCGDSRREVPRLLRILDDAGVEHSRVRLYNLDRSKTSRDGLAERWAIERVPTFIVLRRGHEVGRIVERPRSTLEGDLLSLLALPE